MQSRNSLAGIDLQTLTAARYFLATRINRLANAVIQGTLPRCEEAGTVTHMDVLTLELNAIQTEMEIRDDAVVGQITQRVNEARAAVERR